jgi:hypothetical protein
LRRFFPAVLLALLVCTLQLATPAVVIGQELPGREKRTVTMGFYVFNIRDLNLREQHFTADFYCWIRYSGPRDEDLERIEFANGRTILREESERSVGPNENYFCWRYAAIFQTRFNLQNYPFDTQRLEIMVEHPAQEADQLVYVHDEASYKRSPSPSDRWGIKNGLSVADFTVMRTELKSDRYAYETDFGHVETATIGSNYSRLILSVKVKRNFEQYFYKLVVPFLVIVAVAYLAFWLPPQEILTSSVLAMIALLTGVAFQLTVSQNLPDTGYLVVADKFFLATLLLIFGTLVHSIGTYNLAREGREDAAYKADVAARVVFPIVYAAVFAFLLWRALGGVEA